MLTFPENALHFLCFFGLLSTTHTSFNYPVKLPPLLPDCYHPSGSVVILSLYRGCQVYLAQVPLYDGSQHLSGPYCFLHTLSKRHCLLFNRQWAFFLLVMLAGALSHKSDRLTSEKTHNYPYNPSPTLFHPSIASVMTFSQVSDHKYMLNPHIIQ